jgi:hypothetical protein
MWGPNFDWLPDQDHGSNLMERSSSCCSSATATRSDPAGVAGVERALPTARTANTVEVDYRRGRS